MSMSTIISCTWSHRPCKRYGRSHRLCKQYRIIILLLEKISINILAKSDFVIQGVLCNFLICITFGRLSCLLYQLFFSQFIFLHSSVPCKLPVCNELALFRGSCRTAQVQLASFCLNALLLLFLLYNACKPQCQRQLYHRTNKNVPVLERAVIFFFLGHKVFGFVNFSIRSWISTLGPFSLNYSSQPLKVILLGVLQSWQWALAEYLSCVDLKALYLVSKGHSAERKPEKWTDGVSYLGSSRIWVEKKQTKQSNQTKWTINRRILVFNTLVILT